MSAPDHMPTTVKDRLASKGASAHESCSANRVEGRLVQQPAKGAGVQTVQPGYLYQITALPTEDDHVRQTVLRQHGHDSAADAVNRRRMSATAVAASFDEHHAPRLIAHCPW